MELGNFLGKLKGDTKVQPQKFLALLLTDEVVQASIWHVQDQITEIFAIGTPVEWDGDTGTTSELITAVDATISSATEGLDVEPSRVILGIPHTWTDKNGVLGVKREFISKIRKELELEPIGYVVITDSILSYLKMQEGTPTTSLLVQISRQDLIIVIVRLGRIEGISTIARSDDVTSDIIQGITQLKIADNLPSRIILFNSMHDLSDIIQNLLSVDWPKQFNFLHLPKIEALPKDVAIRALSVAGGSEVAKSLGFTISEVDSLKDQSDEPEAPAPSPEPLTTPSDHLLTAQDVGFSVGNSSLDEPVKPATSHKIELPKIRLTYPKLPNIHLPSFKSTWLFGGASLVLFLGLLLYLFWTLIKVDLTIFVEPKTLDQNVNLTLSTNASSIDYNNKLVPAQIESIVESGEKTVSTTGKKIVGELARGEVTIYNRTSSSKSFPKGTVLSSNNLKFSLDSDVSVASKSAGSEYVDIPGKQTVKITALSIGEASNLSADSEFIISSFGKDSYVAKNDSALSGGTSEEVKVVSKEDEKTLTSDLTTEILDAIKSKFDSSLDPGVGIYLIEDSVKSDSADYSAKIGDRAEQLTLSLSLKAMVLKYQIDDVTTLVNSSIDQAVPQGYIRANIPSQVELNASTISETGDLVEGEAKVNVSLLPVLNNTAIADSLKSRQFSHASSVLPSLVPGYRSSTLEISPKFLVRLIKKFPYNKSNIRIKLSPLSL